jgi:hypothetical protein
MKIEGTSNLRPTSGAKKKKTEGASGFAEMFGAAKAESSAASNQAAETTGVGSVGALLALQEVGGQDEQRQAMQYGEDLLASLERIRFAIMEGRVSLSALHNIQQQMAQKKITTSDPKLIQLIDEIELRAAVEVAKIEVHKPVDAAENIGQ